MSDVASQFEIKHYHYHRLMGPKGTVHALSKVFQRDALAAVVRPPFGEPLRNEPVPLRNYRVDCREAARELRETLRSHFPDRKFAYFEDPGWTWHDNGTYQEVAPEVAAPLLPPLVADDLPARPPARGPHPPDDAWVLAPLRPRLALVPPAIEPGAARPRPVPPLAKTAASSINCSECATPLDLDFDVWPDGPNWAGLRKVDVQGLGRPRCPNPECLSNGGRPPESRLFLCGNTRDEDGE